MLKAGGKDIAYDWGVPRFDSQHYEGYTISLDYLLQAVADLAQVGGLGPDPAEALCGT